MEYNLQKTKRREGCNKHSSLERKSSWIAFGFISIKLVGFLSLTVFPILMSVLYSFTSLNPRINTGFFFAELKNIWVGVDNYVKLFNNDVYRIAFFNAVENTVIQLIGIPFGIGLGLLIAMLLSTKGLRGGPAFRMLIYIPVVASAIAVGYIWQYIFHPTYGLVNNILGLKIHWIEDARYVKVAIIIKQVWAMMGSTMLLYYSSLVNISPDYYEVADLEGANAWQKFWSITWPMLMPVTFYLLTIRLINGFQSYNDSLIFAAGTYGARTVVYFIWEYGINALDYGIASTASVLLSIVILILTIFQFKLNDKRMKLE